MSSQRIPHIQSPFTGGPLSQSIHILYRQLRCMLPTEPDVDEEIKSIFKSRPILNLDIHLLDAINVEYKSFRKAFNRNSFRMNNILHFSDEQLRESEAELQNAKDLLEQRIISHVIEQVQNILDCRRYILLLLPF